MRASTARIVSRAILVESLPCGVVPHQDTTTDATIIAEGRSDNFKCDGKTPCERCSHLRIPCIYESRQLKTKAALCSERAALLAHDAAYTAILQALASGNHDMETLIALWRRKPIWQIAETLSALQLGNEQKHDIFERFTQ